MVRCKWCNLKNVKYIEYHDKDNTDETTIYLIRHAETVDEKGIKNTSENSQLINEKE